MKETSSDQSLEELSLTHHRLVQSASSVPAQWPPGCPPPSPAALSSPSPRLSLSLRIPCTTRLLFFALSFGQSQTASVSSWSYLGQTQTHCWTAQSCTLVHLCRQKIANGECAPKVEVHLYTAAYTVSHLKTTVSSISDLRSSPGRSSGCPLSPPPSWHVVTVTVLLFLPDLQEKPNMP